MFSPIQIVGTYFLHKAIVDYSKAIEIAPKDANAYFNRGLAYGKKNEHDKAIADYGKVIEIDPTDFNTYFNRGLAYRAKGDKVKADADFAKAKELGYKP